MSDSPTLHEKLTGEPAANGNDETVAGRLIVDDPGLPDVINWARSQISVTPRLPAYTPKEVFPAILGSAELPADEGAGTIDEIVARLLDAPTLEAALQQQQTESLEGILGVTLMVDRPRWYPTDYAEQTSRCFVVVEAIEWESGVVHTVTIGSTQPMVAIWRAWAEGKLPLKCIFHRSEKKTRAGFYPYNLVGA